MSTDDSLQSKRVTVTAKKVRSGYFCIKIQWKLPNKEPKEYLADNSNLVDYLAQFKIEHQSCKYFMIATFIRRKENILCRLNLSRRNGRENNNFQRPCAVSVFINEEETRHKLIECFSDEWYSEFFNGSFACPDGIEIRAITRETRYRNEWKPWTCLLLIEFETFSGGERNALKQLTELYVQQNQCDVQFYFEDHQHIGGHSCILAARSPVFAAMFQHEMKETKTGKVSIQDIQPDIFKQLLHYIYSGRLSILPTETTAQRLFEAADKYDIGDLKEECVSFLLTCIRVENVIHLMAWAHIHLIGELKEEALTFTSLRGKEICLLKDWETLMKNYPDVCLEASRRIIGQMSLSLERLIHSSTIST